MRLCVLFGSLAGVWGITEKTFHQVKNTPGDQFAVFYRSSDPTAKATLALVEKVEQNIKDMKWSFQKADGDLPVNKADFENAGFKKGVYLFTASMVQGIERYEGPVEVAAMEEHIRFFGMPEGVVSSYTDEDAFFEALDRLEPPPKPIMLKIDEKDCESCQLLEKFWTQAAHHFKDQADFAQMTCSATASTKAFCQRLGVATYPSFWLWTGEARKQYDNSFRSVLTLRPFLKEHLSTSDTAPDSSNKQEKRKEVKPEQPAKAEAAKAEPAPTKTDKTTVPDTPSG
eukprot:g56585.t1